MNIPSLFCAVTLILVTASSGAESFSAAIKKLPAETGASSFATGWIPLGLKAADMQEKQVAPGHITDVGEAQLQFHFPAGWRPQDKRPALCIFPGGGYILMTRKACTSPGGRRRTAWLGWLSSTAFPRETTI